MVATNGRTVTVFGGTGFLGRRIVRHLRYRKFAVRIASRHPDRGHGQFGPDDPQLQSVEAPSTIFELGGPQIYSYEQLLRAVAHQAGLAPVLLPIPFAVWHALAWASEKISAPLLTRNQVELMQIDTVSSVDKPGFFELGISPHPVEAILQKMLSNCGSERLPG
jgi:uncharacterized protein YbjT (DUF2867 family)